MTRVALLWHMHQPFYQDLVTGEHFLPWVRLHALKDYRGMVKLLDEFPDIHQTFNLVPALIAQIQDYADGNARDPFWEVAAKPAADLTLAEREFALRYLFQANPHNMIGRYPRYQELWEKFQSLSGHAAQAAPLMENGDLTDLQVLSQIAWFDEFELATPEVRELIAKGRDFDRHDQQFVIEREKQMLAAVLPAYAGASARGLIEISTSPYYHPILPLVCDSGMGAVSHDGLPLPQRPFRHPEDAREQIVRAMALHEKVFGVKPLGMWPSEGSVSDETLAIAHSAGIRWMASDEGVLGRSIGRSFARDGQGHLQPDAAESLYRIYRWSQKAGSQKAGSQKAGSQKEGLQKQKEAQRKDASMRMIFRDHSLSDLIGFVYCGVPAADAARDFLRRTKEACRPILDSGTDAIVPVILDGENAWEYYPKSGREFLRRLYEGIGADPVFKAQTVSEVIESRPPVTEMASIFPGSWINANFDVWIGAPEDNVAWDALSEARDFYNENAAAATPEQKALAFEELMIAEGSDWNWWYGPEHHSANDRDFDELYRKHLSNVYQALGAAPPESLARSIIADHKRPKFAAQTAYISPRVGSLSASYFDWLGAACLVADRSQSAMHGGSFLLDTGYAGVDAEYLYCRLDFMANIAEWAGEGATLVLNIEAHRMNNCADEAIACKLEVALRELQVKEWVLDDGKTTSNKIDGALFGLRKGMSFECRIPLSAIHAAQGSVLHIRFSLWRDRLPLDALPREGAIELYVVPEDELGAMAYAKP